MLQIWIRVSEAGLIAIRDDMINGGWCTKRGIETARNFIFFNTDGLGDGPFYPVSSGGNRSKDVVPLNGRQPFSSNGIKNAIQVASIHFTAVIFSKRNQLTNLTTSILRNHLKGQRIRSGLFDQPVVVADIIRADVITAQ